MIERDPRFDVSLPCLWQPWKCTDLCRIGAANDGGYLVSLSDIMATKKLVTYGINDDWSFEQDFLDINDCELDAYDGQIPEHARQRAETWFQGRRRVIHQNIYAASQNQGVTVAETINADGIFLKCDIEEDEMKIFDDILCVSDLLTGIVMEVHRVNIWDNYNLVTDFISKIPLKLLHVHANNYGYAVSPSAAAPNNFELTFGRGPCELDRNLTLPHQLDAPNNPRDPDFRISFDIGPWLPK